MPTGRAGENAFTKVSPRCVLFFIKRTCILALMRNNGLPRQARHGMRYQTLSSMKDLTADYAAGCSCCQRGNSYLLRGWNSHNAVDSTAQWLIKSLPRVSVHSPSAAECSGLPSLEPLRRISSIHYFHESCFSNKECPTTHLVRILN